MEEKKYYDGTKLLSLKDANGKDPEIFMSTTNRSAGKTTYFNRLVVNKYLRGDGKFCLLYRWNYELSECADKFFKDIRSLFFSNYVMTERKCAKGVYYELLLNDNVCGYATSLNNADALKKYSHLLSDCCCILMDEFQSETNHYCDKEVEKFISIHTSLARGRGEQVKYLPVYMISNAVSIINPYYTAMKISNRLHADTKFLKGDGFVLEQGYMDTVAKAQQESAFNRAFSDNKYVAYASQNIYLNDNISFVEKPEGKGRYLATLAYNGKHFALREFSEQGIIYCDDKPDMTYPSKLAVTTDDHKVNYVMLKSNDLFFSQLRYLFNKGSFRFRNLMCKECVMTALSY